MRRALAVLLIAFGGPALAEETVAFFGVTLLDSSLQTATQGQDPAELKRLEMVEALIADRFTQEGFTLVDIAPVQQDLDRIVNPANGKTYKAKMQLQSNGTLRLWGYVGFDSPMTRKAQVWERVR